MRAILMVLLMISASVPTWAQDAEDSSDPEVATLPTEDKKDGVKKDDAEKAKKPEITQEGKLLLEDVERVLSKHNEILIDDTMAKGVWDTAVKETKNAAYKNPAEFNDAIAKMKRKDKAFKAQVIALFKRKSDELTDSLNALRAKKAK